MALMTLGLFVFEHQKTMAPDNLQRTSSYKWASHKPVGRAPKHQFLGEDEDTINLKGVLYPEFTGGRANLDTLRDMSKTGKAYLLMTGYGEVIGNYFIKQITETQSHFLKDGAAQKIEFSLSLARLNENQNPQEFIGDISAQVYQITEMKVV